MHAHRGGFVDLYWLPLGAGGHSVRLNGRIFEAIASRIEGRDARDLYHSALEVRVRNRRFVVEQAPVGDRNGRARGAVVEGPVGTRAAGRLRLFRYEIRCWADGVIPDVAEAVESPRRLTSNLSHAQRLIRLVPRVPALVWGRDELGLGEMWSSNSVISWLVASSGLEAGAVEPPSGGRAPGWQAGIELERRKRTGVDWFPRETARNSEVSRMAPSH
jgi:hypothetical protein